MSKINRFFERVIKEEQVGTRISFYDKTFFSYGYSNENSLFNPLHGNNVFLVTYLDSAKSSALERGKKTGGIPTVAYITVNSDNILKWDELMYQKYGRLFDENIVADYSLNNNIFDIATKGYDGIYFGGVAGTLIMKTIKSVNKYRFFVKNNWSVPFKEDDALTYLNDIFEVDGNIIDQYDLAH